MKFLVDANLPPALAAWLASQGHDAHHLTELGLERMSDREIWARARDIGACVVTKDEDFVMMRALDNQGPAVIWVRTGNTTKRALLARFSRSFAAIIASLERGETIIEISEH